MSFTSDLPERFAEIWVRPQDISWQIDWNQVGLQELILNKNLRGQSRLGIAQQVRRTLITGPEYLRDDDFDRYICPFDTHPTMQRMRLRLIKQKSWEEAGFFEWMRMQIALREQQLWSEVGFFRRIWRQILRNAHHDGVKNERGIKARYAQFDALISDAREMGRLRSRNELHGEPDESRGIMVGISRDGKLIFMGRGTHRLAIAQLLELERVPVGICTIHAQAAKAGKGLVLHRIAAPVIAPTSDPAGDGLSCAP